MVVKDYPGLSIVKQCELLGINRSTYYYLPSGETPLNLKLMKLIDKKFTDTPFYGIRKITDWLSKSGYIVNHKRVARLMQKMGLRTIYCKPKRLSLSKKEHQKYPYLLKNMRIDKPDQVWATDITYIPVENGFFYLMAIMDWYSRYVIAWELSNTLEVDFCIKALNKSLRKTRPTYFNSDQGSQFTSESFTNILIANEIKISMDSRGRFYDNIFIERLWRTVKYEEIYLKSYCNGWEVENNLKKYFKFYNKERSHQSLGYKTPADVYFLN